MALGQEAYLTIPALDRAINRLDDKIASSSSDTFIKNKYEAIKSKYIKAKNGILKYYTKTKAKHPELVAGKKNVLRLIDTKKDPSAYDNDKNPKIRGGYNILDAIEDHRGLIVGVAATVATYSLANTISLSVAGKDFTHLIIEALAKSGLTAQAGAALGVMTGALAIIGAAYLIPAIRRNLRKSQKHRTAVKQAQNDILQDMHLADESLDKAIADKGNFTQQEWDMLIDDPKLFTQLENLAKSNSPRLTPSQRIKLKENLEKFKAAHTYNETTKTWEKKSAEKTETAETKKDDKHPAISSREAYNKSIKNATPEIIEEILKSPSFRAMVTSQLGGKSIPSFEEWNKSKTTLQEALVAVLGQFNDEYKQLNTLGSKLVGVLKSNEKSLLRQVIVSEEKQKVDENGKPLNKKEKQRKVDTEGNYEVDTEGNPVYIDVDVPVMVTVSKLTENAKTVIENLLSLTPEDKKLIQSLGREGKTFISKYEELAAIKIDSLDAKGIESLKGLLEFFDKSTITATIASNAEKKRKTSSSAIGKETKKGGIEYSEEDFESIKKAIDAKPEGERTNQDKEFLKTYGERQKFSEIIKEIEKTEQFKDLLNSNEDVKSQANKYAEILKELGIDKNLSEVTLNDIKDAIKKQATQQKGGE